MIVFELTCTHGHRFEGWFDSSDEFARQCERSLVTCPICDDAHVERVPYARVNVPKAQQPAPQAPAAKTQEVAAGVPPEMLAKLREIVKQTENVGRRFPEEARKIHYEEIPPRPIRGQASPEEAQALNDEGIDFSPLPPFLLPDQH